MILEQFRLDGKLAAVTGTSRGLGQALAIGLAEAGADIVAIDRSGSNETAQAVESLGRSFRQLHCDLATATQADLQQVIDDAGSVDILVNNAGIIRRAPALDFSESDWDDVMQVNLRSLFFLSQAAARGMVGRGGGKIIQIASMLSFQGGITVPSYTAAKSAVAGLTRALANEWASKNINVNAIAPGWVLTERQMELWGDPVALAKHLDRQCLKEHMAAEDLVGTVLFLSSNASRMMTGQCVAVDGGVVTVSA